MRNEEALLWAMLHAVESHTVSRYRAVAPDLLNARKRAATAAIAGMVPPGTTLVGTPLDDAVNALLSDAMGDGTTTDALLLQGVVLERLGVTIYRMFGEGDRLSPTGTEVAARAGQSSTEVSELAVALLRDEIPDPIDRFYAFTGRTEAMFLALDALGEALDACFAGPFHLQFADVMGDFVADLLPACTHGLGFERRKVIVHLTTALMA